MDFRYNGHWGSAMSVDEEEEDSDTVQRLVFHIFND
jgi:hypothetical protein